MMQMMQMQLALGYSVTLSKKKNQFLSKVPYLTYLSGISGIDSGKPVR